MKRNVGVFDVYDRTGGVSKRQRGNRYAAIQASRRRHEERAQRAVALYKAMPRRAHPVRNVRTGGFLNMELKFYDTANTGININTSTDGSAGEQDPTSKNCLNAVAQGDGEQQRDGR